MAVGTVWINQLILKIATLNSNQYKYNKAEEFVCMFEHANVMNVIRYQSH